MKTIDKLAAQGDVLFRRIAALPSGAIQDSVTGPLIVAHSETGHNHEIRDPEVKLFQALERDPMICYLQIAGAFADVIHYRSFDTHETLRLPGGGSTWEVRRQREYTPEGWRRVED